MEKDVRTECQQRIADILHQHSDFHTQVDLSVVRLQAPHPSQYLVEQSTSSVEPERHGGGRWVKVEDILTTERLDGTAARAWVLSGEPGHGRSTLGLYIAHSWAQRTPLIHGLQTFQGVLLLCGKEVASQGCWELTKPYFTNTTSKWGSVELAEWVENARLLVIIDDYCHKMAEAEVEEALTDWVNSDFLVITTQADAQKTVGLLTNNRHILSFTLSGLDMSGIAKLATKHLSPSQHNSFCQWVRNNSGIAMKILKNPNLVKLICQAWSSNYINSTTTTSTQLLWNMIDALRSQNLYIDVESLDTWLLAVGQFARESLETETPFRKEYLQDKSNKIFNEELTDKLMGFLPFSVSMSSKSLVSYPLILAQFLAAWDVLHQNLKGSPMKRFVKKLIDEDNVMVFVAGHLAHVLDYNPDLSDKQICRAAKNLILHMDRATDSLGYLLRIINEFRTSPQILQILETEVGLTRYWEVQDEAVLSKPLVHLLQYEKPDKVLVSMERNRDAPDMEGAVTVMAKHQVPMFLANMNHLVWENPDTTDNLIHIIQREDGRIEDFIGSLTGCTIRSLGETEATSNLVCLRVRVHDVDAAEAALRSPFSLPKLMWLEVDFDLPIKDLVIEKLPKVNTPLMDVCFKDISDSDVPLLCEVLVHLRKAYSGLHMTRSNITPRGITEILKYCFKHGIQLTVEDAVINRYRRWRYPALASLDRRETMTYEHVEHLVGYDDRKYYSDNEAITNMIISGSDARTLAHFLAILSDLVYFRYLCGNYCVTKTCDGETKVDALL